MSGSIHLRPVVACGRCPRQVVLDADNARAAVAPATRAGWRKDGRWWLCPLCPLCVAVTTGPARRAIRERIADEVAAMGDDDLALLHGAVVTAPSSWRYAGGAGHDGRSHDNAIRATGAKHTR